jgi:hypothetical protein
MNREAQLDFVKQLHTPSAADWESIPSGLGSRFLIHLMSRNEIGRNNTPMSDSDICSLSASGAFGGAVAFVFGDAVGSREWRSRWVGNYEAMTMLLALNARRMHSSIRLTLADVNKEIMRHPEIIKAFAYTSPFDTWGSKTPFKVLDANDIIGIYAEDKSAVAAMVTGDMSMVKTVLQGLPEGECADFMHDLVEIYNSRGTLMTDAISSIGRFIPPDSPKGQALVDAAVPIIGRRWSSKADRTLRTHHVLERDNPEWREGEGERGWLRNALLHCTKETPDRLVSWIGQAPCLYEFLNTAAKQRRGVIAARRLIKMMGR